MSDIKKNLPSFEFGDDGLMKSFSMPDECDWWPHSGSTMHDGVDHESFAEEIKKGSPSLLKCNFIYIASKRKSF